MIAPSGWSLFLAGLLATGCSLSTDGSLGSVVQASDGGPVCTGNGTGYYSSSDPAAAETGAKDRAAYDCGSIPGCSGCGAYGLVYYQASVTCECEGTACYYQFGDGLGISSSPVVAEAASKNDADNKCAAFEGCTKCGQFDPVYYLADVTCTCN